MIFSVNWLREWIDPEMDVQSLMDELTMAGLEVDGFNSVAKDFSGLVVGEVQSVEKHPNADKLSVCTVTDGTDSYQVVCGAPNVATGMRVPFARVGAEFISENEEKPFKIKAAKLRGMESNGMLCSAEELGLEESSDGLLALAADAPLGECVRDYLNLNDISIELDLTPNRGDCLGMIGLAREVAVLVRGAVSEPDTNDISEESKASFPIEIAAKDACPRYLGRVIKNIDLDGQTPLWMSEKLRRSGLRSIDPIVDVTNYVLLELGQPMHAFDYEKLVGKIDVRMARKDEKLTLLDGKEISLSPETLVISDADKAVAMAGIMGGLETAVSDQTKDVFLECAFFAPLAIAGKARSYGMHTDASHRYERGVDYNLQARAMERATQLLLDIVGGEAGPVTEAVGNLPASSQVVLKFESVAKFLGIEIPIDEVVDILSRLGFTPVEQSTSELSVAVPSFRFDVSIEADLIEELARIYGYNNLPKTPGFGGQSLKSRPEALLSLQRLRLQLVGLGYQEAITYSFIDPDLATIVCPSIEPIMLQNPISAEMSVMRTSLLPGLLSTLGYNENRQQDRMRLFETGLVFSKRGGETLQTEMLGGVISGKKFPENWNNNNEVNDFYDLKGDIELLLGLGGKSAEFDYLPAQKEGFHSGQCAEVQYQGACIGYLGALHPAIQRKLGITAATFMFELELAAVQKSQLPTASVLSKYPEVNRDLAIVIAETVAANDILGLIRESAGEFLTKLRIFDVYQGDAVAKGEKSVALGLTWQHPSRTLSDEEINTIISSCVNALHDKFNANLRN